MGTPLRNRLEKSARAHASAKLTKVGGRKKKRSDNRTHRHRSVRPCDKCHALRPADPAPYTVAGFAPMNASNPLASNTSLEPRRVARLVQSLSTVEGGGFPVRRPFPIQGFSHFDPFLLIDHLGPVNWPPGGPIGAPDHPHRGFETVTYVLAGENEHRDSFGNADVLRPGDVQWMTAGGGVIHAEMPTDRFHREGGVQEGFQIWVNLPAVDKMMTPRYQTLRDRRHTSE